MRTVNLRIPGAFRLIPELHADERGFFCLTGETGLVPESGRWRWCMSRSVTGTIRGLHVRSGDGENKLVRCSAGVIYDVIVDLRKPSPAYKTWEAVRHVGGAASHLVPVRAPRRRDVPNHRRSRTGGRCAGRAR